MAGKDKPMTRFFQDTRSEPVRRYRNERVRTRAAGGLMQIFPTVLPTRRDGWIA